MAKQRCLQWRELLTPAMLCPRMKQQLVV